MPEHGPVLHPPLRHCPYFAIEQGNGTDRATGRIRSTKKQVLSFLAMGIHEKCKQNTAFPVSNRVGSKQTRFEALVYALSADLYRYAFWLCRDRGRAEELVQETFLRAWRSLDSLRDEKAAKGWLITILRREHARWYERYRPEIEHGQEPDDLAGRADSMPAETLAVRRTIADLDADYREPLLLQVLGGYSCEEIANFLGLSKGAVMTRLFRARQKLRATLEGQDDTTVSHRSQP